MSGETVNQPVLPAVRAEQVRTLFSHQPLTLGGTSAVAIMALIVLLPFVERVGLLVWFALVALLVALRAWCYVQFRRRNVADHEIGPWASAAVALALCSGFLWGWLPAAYINGDQPFTMINIVVFSVGMLAGSLISQSVYLPAYFSFSLPLAIALSVSVHVNGGPYSALAWLGYIFTAVIFGFCMSSNRVFRESIETRFENSRLLEELRVQKQEAESASLAKSQFLAAASHDLRQPLHSLGLYSGALSDSVTEDKQRDLTKKMAVAIRSLDQLFEHILEISKLDAGVVSPDKRSMGLAELVQRLELRYAALADRQGLSFECSTEDHCVRSDAILLERILDNLLANAFRYTDMGFVRLETRCVDRCVQVSVSDSGRGIPAAETERIFDEFYQLENPERDRQKGLGLGLSIVRRLCGLLGHRLTLDTSPAQGSAFHVWLEAGDPQRIETAAADSVSFDWDIRDKRVLVIDDEQAVLDAVRQQLESWGCIVRTAVDADEAVDSREPAPTVILADYRLRDNASGIGAIEHVRNEYGAAIPAVLMTGDTAPERLQEARRRGLKVVHKPVSPGQLRMVINRLIASAEA